MTQDEQDMKVAQTHDGFVKAVFTTPACARALFQSHLPADMVKIIDWDSLTFHPQSYIKSSLRQTHSDLVFEVTLKGGSQAKICLLFEHQTTVDGLMPLRLLGYVSELLNRHALSDELSLPLVIPFVLHQGPEKWTVSERFHSLFVWPPEGGLERFMPSFDYVLLDLSQLNPAQDESDGQMRIVLQLMKLARTRNLLEFFSWLASEYHWAEQSLTDRLLRLCLVYAVNNDANLDVETIATTLASVPQLQEKAMSLAQKLRAEGRVEGRVEGRAEGLAKGEWIGKLRLLQQLMEHEVTTTAALSQLSITELEERFISIQAEYNRRFK